MKRIIKSTLSLVIAMCLMISLFTFTASAASVSVGGGGEYTVGQSVKVTVNFNADANLYAVEVTASYNSSVLELTGVSGADYNGGGGTVKIVDDGFSATKPTKSSSYTLNFKAIAAGSSKVSVSVLGGGEATSSASGAANITVVTPKPSSNANLGSLKLSDGALSPAFSAGNTNYSAKVKYSVESIQISASVADGGAKAVGAGSYKLDVGENTFTITVTAADGTKKSYTVKVTRMTEEETAAADAAEREANPLLVVIDDVDYFILQDVTNIPVPADYTLSTATRKEAELPVFVDNSGRYTLYYLTDAEGANGDFYSRDENDNFTKLAYVNDNGKMYIVEPPSDDIIVPTGYIAAECEIAAVKVKGYQREIAGLEDFYVLNCYSQGENAYYRYDKKEGTLQRAADFDLAISAMTAEPEEPENIFKQFVGMNKTGKTVIIIVLASVIIIVVLLVYFIVNLAKGKTARVKMPEVHDESETNSEDDDVALNGFVFDDEPQPPQDDE